MGDGPHTLKSWDALLVSIAEAQETLTPSADAQSDSQPSATTLLAHRITPVILTYLPPSDNLASTRASEIAHDFRRLPDKEGVITKAALQECANNVLENDPELCGCGSSNIRRERQGGKFLGASRAMVV
jgi:hypothetical protein